MADEFVKAIESELATVAATAVAAAKAKVASEYLHWVLAIAELELTLLDQPVAFA